MDERHYTALTKKIDDVLESIRPEWSFNQENNVSVDNMPHHDYENDERSSIYSESSINYDANHSPATTSSERYSRAPSLDAAYDYSALSPTESWSSDVSELPYEEHLTTATDHLRIRRDYMADDSGDLEPLPIITTQQMSAIIENLPHSSKTHSLNVSNGDVEHGVPFSYSKEPSVNSTKDDSSQSVKSKFGSRVKRSSSLLPNKASIKTMTKFSWAAVRIAF